MLIYKEKYKKEAKESKVFVLRKFFREKEKNARSDLYIIQILSARQRMGDGRWNSLEYFMRASTFEMALLT